MHFDKKITWIKISGSEELLREKIQINRATVFYIGSKKICIARTPLGFFGIDDKCPHNSGSLSEGQCTDGNAIVCPVHRYAFDLKTGRATSGLGDAARTYPVEIRNDGVFLGFEKMIWKWF